MFTTLTVDEMVSIVVAAQPGTAVHYAVNGGWTTEGHLLATMYEHQNGFQHRIARPGVTDTRPAKPASIHDHSKPFQKITFDVTTIDELEARRRAKGA